jgi:hypothetical protein
MSFTSSCSGRDGDRPAVAAGGGRGATGGPVVDLTDAGQ